MKRLRRVQTGDRVALVAPASSFPREEVERGAAELARLGLEAVYDESLFEKDRFVAGSVETRVRAIVRAWEDPSIAALIAVRGGYVGELAWASTGEHLAISTYSLDRRNHSVLMLDMATAQVRYLVDGCHLTWSPDGAFLAIHRDPGPEGGAWVVSPAGETLYAISREEQAFPYAWVA